MNCTEAFQSSRPPAPCSHMGSRRTRPALNSPNPATTSGDHLGFYLILGRHNPCCLVLKPVGEASAQALTQYGVLMSFHPTRAFLEDTIVTIIRNVLYIHGCNTTGQHYGCSIHVATGQGLLLGGKASDSQ